MNFGELRFWLYLSAILGLILSLRPLFKKWAHGNGDLLGRYDRTSILSTGLILLGLVSAGTLAIFLFVCMATYAGLSIFLRTRGSHRYLFLTILVPLQLLPLAYYKYSHFLANEILGLNLPGLSDLIIPVGLSFYTFQVVGFLIDTVIRKEPLPAFLDFMNFAAFFPQIVAGPIERREHLLPQMQGFRFRWNPQDIDAGAKWIVLGLFFKICLADNLALHFDRSPTTNPFTIWLNNIIFGFRIYYDFAGYSFVALGIARCFGIRLTLNFASPYLSTNTQEFWRRWHITLSTWFRDYIYLPMGGNRTKMWFLGIIAVFVLSGIWHGAGWNFMLWGLLWAAFLIAFHAFKKICIPIPIAWLATMTAAFFAWLCFYETNTEVLLAKLSTTLNPLNYTAPHLHSAIASLDPTQAFILVAFLLLALLTLAGEWLSLKKTGQPYYYFLQPASLVALVALTILLAPSRKNDFIYFAF